MTKSPEFRTLSPEVDPWAETPERLALEQQMAQTIEAKRQMLITATSVYDPTGEQGAFVRWEYDGGFRPVYRTEGGIEFLVPLYPSCDSPFNAQESEQHEEK